MAKLTTKQVKALKKIRKRVEATHWVKGTFAKFKELKTGHVAEWIAMPVEVWVDGKEPETFEANSVQYKSCACLVGLVRWQMFGVRYPKHVINDPEYTALVDVIANQLVATGRVSDRQARKLEEAGVSSVAAKENVVINWNDRSHTSRKNVLELLTEIIGD